MWKILAGHDSAKKFDEEIIGKLIKLQEKVAGIESMCRTSRAPETVKQVMVMMITMMMTTMMTMVKMITIVI